MSEFINTRDNRATIRWKLLTSASALTLISSLSLASAEDADRPLIWFELGGQMENVTGQGEVFTPTFMAANPTSSVLLEAVTPLQAQKPVKFGFGEEGKISFQPEDSSWLFAASMHIGRSSNFRHVDHQTANIFYRTYKYGVAAPHQNIHETEDFVDTHARRQESHAIVDFSVGKDVGLGLFGKGSSSAISAGVRFAQFTSKATFDARARPDLQFKYQTFASYGYPSDPTLKLPHFHTYHATGHALRSFRGLGPSLSWTGSTPFAGNPQDGEITVDWSANAALLFGKQKAHVQHGEVAHYFSPAAGFLNGNPYTVSYPSAGGGHSKIRNVTVPNVGGSLGLSYRYQDAKISLGYRADFFFGAMDTGIDAVKKSNLAFNGPYASISFGIGD